MAQHDIPLPYLIRTATPEENFLLAEIGAETFYDSFASQNDPDDMSAYLAESFNPVKQAEELADKNTKFLLAEFNGQVVGYARIHFGKALPCVEGEHPMEIVRFYARKAWIGKGVGAALMRACLQEAGSAGCDVVWLDVWEKNQRAIDFYEKWGFEIVGQQIFKLGGDLQQDYIMSKSLSKR